MDSRLSLKILNSLNMPIPPKPRPPADEVKTLTIDKFNGRLTRFRDGDINSGYCNFYTSWGYDCFILSGTLTFAEGATDIKKGVITDLIMAAKPRVESGITYVYAIGHLKRLYKIQVNNTTTKNPDYDTPVLIGTLASSQTFLYGASLDFRGSTEKIWIGHDAGITIINFDGSGEVNYTAGWTANVPRQQVQLGSSVYFTDGSNLAAVSPTTETVTTHTSITPGFPANWQARDLDLTPDGRYVVATVTRNPMSDLTSPTPNTSEIASTPSMLVYWNATDTVASSSISFPSFSMTSYYTFGNKDFIFGYQIGGSMLGTPKEGVILVDEFTNPPLPNAIGSSGDFLSWATTGLNVTTGHSNAIVSIYGTIDKETTGGHYRQLIKASTLDGGDIVRVPFYISVSSFVNAGSVSGYSTAPYNLVGTGKTYFSTLEYNGSTTSYGFWMFKNVQSYLTNTNTGVYETQHQVFSRKIKPTEVRAYFEPAGALAAGVSFKIDLIGIDGSVLTGGTYTFSSSNQITATSNTGQYPCAVGATPVMGVRVTNVGIYTPFIHRIEIDYTKYGD